MAKQPRSDQTVDRVEIRGSLSRLAVIRATQSLVAPFSVEDVAQAMGENEYRVRASIGWLAHQGRVVPVGHRVKISPTGRVYQVAVYEARGGKVANFALLYRALGLAGETMLV